MQSPVLATVELSVSPSVCLSVTRWHCVKTTHARIAKSSPTDSPRILGLAIKSSSGNSTGFARAMALGDAGVAKNSQFSDNMSLYLRNGPRLLLMTNRKSHTPFRLVPKSTTVDDLERPFRTLFQNTCVFRSPP